MRSVYADHICRPFQRRVRPPHREGSGITRTRPLATGPDQGAATTRIQWTRSWSNATRIPRLGTAANPIISSFYAQRDQFMPWRPIWLGSAGLGMPQLQRRVRHEGGSALVNAPPWRCHDGTERIDRRGDKQLASNACTPLWCRCATGGGSTPPSDTLSSHPWRTLTHLCSSALEHPFRCIAARLGAPVGRPS